MAELLVKEVVIFTDLVPCFFKDRGCLYEVVKMSIEVQVAKHMDNHDRARDWYEHLK